MKYGPVSFKDFKQWQYTQTKRGSMCSALKHCGVVSKNGKIVQRKKKNVVYSKDRQKLIYVGDFFLLLKNSFFI